MFRIIEGVTRHRSLKRLLLPVLIGLASAAGALIFLSGLEFLDHQLQGVLMGIAHPQPLGEALHQSGPRLSAYAPAQTGNWWLVLLIPTIGGLISGWLVFTFAPLAQGHGIDALISSFHNARGYVATKVPIIKLLASMVTLGSGGSGGKEGPIALIGGGLGSSIARLFKLDPRETRHLLLAGAAGGIGAVFRAPLGAAISSIEILYKEDLETDALLSCVLSSVTAYSCLLLSMRWLSAIFVVPVQDFQPAHLVTLIPMTLAVVMLGRLFIKIFEGTGKLFQGLPLPVMIKPMLGGLLIGVIALWVPQTMGLGMGYLQEALHFDLAGREIWACLGFGALFLALKIITISITIGSGGSAGVFGPSLMVGGLGGSLVGLFCHAVVAPLFPGLPIPPVSTFAILGMASFFAGVAHAPLGALIMTSEMTQGYQLLAPLTLLCMISIFFNGGKSLYKNQVTNKFNSAAHRASISFDILRGVPLRAIFQPTTVNCAPVTSTLSDLRKIMTIQSFSFPLPLVDEHGAPVGLLSMGTLREVILEEEAEELFTAADLMGPLVTCSLDEDLHNILIKFSDHGYGRLPVVDPENPTKLLGFIRYQEIMEAYQRELKERQES